MTAMQKATNDGGPASAVEKVARTSEKSPTSPAELKTSSTRVVWNVPSGPTAPYSEDQIRRLVAGAIQGMDPADVAIVGVVAPEVVASAPHLTSVGPIAVSRGSASTLKLILGSMLGMNVLLALGLVLALVRRRRATGAREGDITDTTGGNRP